MPALPSLNRIFEVTRSQAGNALILVLGAAAVIGLISVEIYRRLDLTLQRSRQSVFKDDVEIIMASIESSMQNPESCTAMLGGLPFTVGGSTPVTLNWTFDPNFPGPLTTGSEVTNNIVIGRITLDPIDITEAPPTDPGTRTDMRTRILDGSGTLVQYIRQPSRLHVSFHSKDGSTVPINRIRTTGGLDLGSPVLIWADSSTQRISACFGRNSAGAMCNIIGGYYVADPTGATPLPLRCRQSGYTEQFIGGGGPGFRNIGSCRFGGYVNNAAECSTRFSGSVAVYNPHQIQMLWREFPLGYLCMLCR
ncbi:MAG: hypothetical protein HC902_03605 [Calothrix sp. SM1_5_4]|nr:hypothetical protein [Calothrix sp. SM1_5_4]